MSHGIGPSTSRRRYFSQRRMVQWNASVVARAAAALVIGGALLFSDFFSASMSNIIDNERKKTALVISTLDASPETDVTIRTSRRHDNNPHQTQEAMPKSVPILYHLARTDRSGAVIHDMLLAHAYAYKNNLTYGGACSNNTTLPHFDEHLIMIEALGLRHVLKFACPEHIMESHSDMRSGLTNRHLYTRFGTRSWTPKWVDLIRSLQHGFNANNIESEPRERKAVVVHIRRGDVSLCDPSTRDRYLPNEHYQSLLQKYDSGTDVTIFSESKSPESWNDFRRHGNYNLQLDRPPVEAWKAMMDADVLILSKSSFSIVPAVFNRRGVVVYTPFWVQPLGAWNVVDDDTCRASGRAVLRLLGSQLCEDYAA